MDVLTTRSVPTRIEREKGAERSKTSERKADVECEYQRGIIRDTVHDGQRAVPSLRLLFNISRLLCFDVGRFSDHRSIPPHQEVPAELAKKMGELGAKRV